MGGCETRTVRAWRRRLLALAAALAAAPASGAAQDDHALPRAALSWVRTDGAEPCIGPTELASRVEEVIGHRVWVPATEAELAVEGWIAAVREGEQSFFEARVQVSDADGQILGRRVMRAPWHDCRLLDEHLALIIALAIDPGEDVAWDAGPGFAPSAAEGEGAQMLAAPQQEGTPTSDGDAKVRARAKESAASSAPALHAGFALGYGQVPGIGAGLVLGVRDWPRTLPLVAEATVWMPARPSLEDTLGHIRYWHADLGLQACPLRAVGTRVSLQACGGVRMALTAARPRGFRQDLDATRLDAGPALSLRLHGWVTESLGIAVDAGLAAPFPRTTFAYLDATGVEHVAFRVPPVRAWVSIGLLGRP
jgi:hypothetical protein